MAERAQNEPTMEEILSSIRKIIADDDRAPARKSQAAVSPAVIEDEDDDTFEAHDYDLKGFSAADLTTEEGVIEALQEGLDEQEMFEDADAFDGFEADDEPGALIEEVDDAFDMSFDDDEVEVRFDRADLESVSPPAPVVPEVRVLSDKPSAKTFEEPRMSKSEPIADARTADAAAGSLGKLLSRVEFGESGGGTMTIEGVVRDMLRPMLKEWLDANLPEIVEKQVEAEVQRIARMAR